MMVCSYRLILAEVMDLISSKKNANGKISSDSIFKRISVLTYQNVKEILDKIFQ